MEKKTKNQGDSDETNGQSSVPKSPPRQADQDPNQETGTWSVWNLSQQGDNFVIPLSRIPMKRPFLFLTKKKKKIKKMKSNNSNEQLKIGFSNAESKGNIILRIPKCIHADLPRIVFEIGFWNNYLSKQRNDLTRGLVQRQRKPRSNNMKDGGPNFDGLGTRRTLVAEYKKLQRGCQLDELSVIQMNSKEPSSFVGNITEVNDIGVMPHDAPYETVKELDIFQSMMMQYPPRKDVTKQRTSFIGNGLSRTVNSVINECFRKAYDKRYKKKCDKLRKKLQKRRLKGKSDDTAIWSKCDTVDLKSMKRQYGGRNVLFENPIKRAKKGKVVLNHF